MALLAYITFPSREMAVATARALLEKRLAAGVNIIPGGASLYHWEGQIRQREEWVAFIQTSGAAWNDLVAAVRQIHSDITPCIVAVEIAKGFSPFLEWIEQNTSLCGSH